jgi:hypothetical protein
MIGETFSFSHALFTALTTPLVEDRPNYPHGERPYAHRQPLQWLLSLSPYFLT